MPDPWNSIDLIKTNLMKLATLPAGAKIGQPNAKGEFKVSARSSDRDDNDSITVVEALLAKFLKRAALVATCDENPQTGYCSGLFNTACSAGLPNLRRSYQQRFLSNLSKSDQRGAVDRLLQFARSQESDSRSWLRTRAEEAFKFVRARYSEGLKSSNKRYEDKPGGTYGGGRVPPAKNTRQPLTLAERNQQVADAASAIGLSRFKAAATQRANLQSAEVGRGLGLAAAKLDVFSMAGEGVRFEDLDRAGRRRIQTFVQGLSPKERTDFSVLYDDWLKWHEADSIQRKVPGHKRHVPEKAQAGNCGELAELVYRHLQREHVPYVSQVCLSTLPGQLVDNVYRGDHAFAIVGLRLDAKPHGFAHPQDLVTLPPSERTTMHDAWVIDPWINEFCTVADYKFRFREKMDIWSRKGKQILVNGSWIDPDPQTRDWYWRTVAELDWLITDYHPWDEQVFVAEERAAAAPQRRAFMLWGP